MTKHSPAASATLPFWVHQVVECLLGLVVVVEATRDPDHAVFLVVLGGALCGVALLSRGALGVLPWIPRSVHRYVDWVLVVALAGGWAFAGVERVMTLAVLAGVAVLLGGLAVRTRWAAMPSLPDVQPLRAPDSLPASASVLARRLGHVTTQARTRGPRALGRAVGRAGRWGPPTGGPPSTDRSSTDRSSTDHSSTDD